VEEDIDIDVMTLNVQTGDRILLCSDGLSNELDPDRLADMASASGSLDDAVTNLVTAAKVAGGRDNISAVLLEFDEAHEPTRTINTTMAAAPPPVEPTMSTRPTKRIPRFTWRVGLGVLLLAGVVSAFFFIMHWYAYSTYYLASDGRYIGVYEGQPAGVLWYQPRLVVATPYLTKELQPSVQLALRSTISEPSITSAVSYAQYLHGLWTTSHTVGSSTTTTTTSPANATTTVKAAG
jgi:hypothetical protein